MTTPMRAIASAGNVETSYRRAGHGPSVVLLGLDWSGIEADAAIAALTGSGFRVFVPEQLSLTALAACGVEPESAFSRWLSGFLDGVGITRAHVVASAAFGEELARFVSLRDARLGVVVCVGARLQSGGPIAPLGDSTHASGVVFIDTAEWGTVGPFLSHYPLSDPATADG